MINSVAEYREMEPKNLTLRVGQLELELLELKEAVRNAKEKNHAHLKVIKKEIARAKTVLKEKDNK
jgi:ribosomal protein L29